jgi:hypothetical protein
MFRTLTTLGWQDAAALAVVLAAAAYLLGRPWRAARAARDIGCGNCRGCALARSPRATRRKASRRL